MTTIINTPASTPKESEGFGFLLGAMLIVAFIAVVVYFGIPALQRSSTQEINIPAPQINIPDKIDVDINK